MSFRRCVIIMILFGSPFVASSVTADAGVQFYTFRASHPVSIGNSPTTVYGALEDALNGRSSVDSTRTAVKALASDSTRLIDTVGVTIAVYCLYPTGSDRPIVTFDEQPRQTTLEAGVPTVLKLISHFAAAAAADTVKMEKATYSLKYVRANLKVTTSTTAKTEVESVEAANVRYVVVADFDSGAKTGDVTIVTGPREAWGWSADLPLNKVSQLKFDPATKTVDLKDEPGTFYVGINYTFGDVIQQPNDLLRALVLKGFLKASKQPLDSYGFGIGLRGHIFNRFGVNLDPISPFVGMTYSRQDAAQAGGTVKSAQRNAKFRWGVGLDIDRTLEWIKGNTTQSTK